MKKPIRGFFAFAAAMTVSANLAVAQVEVLQPEQIESYTRQLPEVSGQVAQNEFKSYLQTLRSGSSDIKEIANAVRVANDVKKVSLPEDAFFGHYAVPALSPVMRLPDAYPADGRFAGRVRGVLAQDQYEDASFVVYPFKNVESVNLQLSPLTTADGHTLPAENIDLRVVKVWYQNGNAWLSYFADNGLKLVPELLLHDENLIRVDTKEQANYARVKTDEGTKEVWISAPQKLDIGFNPYRKGFEDAKTLQPVQFKAGEFKQFFLTVHAAKDTAPGLYTGNIMVSAEGQKTALIPVAVKVLSYQLPAPKTNYDINEDFVVSFYGGWIDNLPSMKNIREHNVLNLGPAVDLGNAIDERSSPEENEKRVQLMKDAGFETNVIFGGGLSWVDNQTFDGQMRMKRMAGHYDAFYKEHFGKTDVILRQGDERGADFMINQRPVWRVLRTFGMKSGLAGNTNTYFNTSAYSLGWRPIAVNPGNKEAATKWSKIGDGYTGFYANQHNGAENPAFVRRQHGLLGYLSNFNMVDNYKFAFGPWNDRAWHLYKPMVLAYPVHNGLVDTIHWQGFRAAIDDIRYATKLRQLANAAIDSGNIDRVEAGRKVRQWFELLDGNTADLNQVRMEMIEKIEELNDLSKAMR